jgi:hypothetical protein
MMISSSRSVSSDASSPSEPTETRVDITPSRLWRYGHSLRIFLTTVRNTRQTDPMKYSWSEKQNYKKDSRVRVSGSANISRLDESCVSTGDMMDRISTSWRSTRSQDSHQVLSSRRCGEKQGKRKGNLWRCYSRKTLANFSWKKSSEAVSLAIANSVDVFLSGLSK